MEDKEDTNGLAIDISEKQKAWIDFIKWEIQSNRDSYQFHYYLIIFTIGAIIGVLSAIYTTNRLLFKLLGIILIFILFGFIYIRLSTLRKYTLQNIVYYKYLNFFLRLMFDSLTPIIDELINDLKKLEKKKSIFEKWISKVYLIDVFGEEILDEEKIKL